MNSTLSQSSGTRTFRVAFAIFALALLALPLVAMQFSTEVNWQVGDFAVFAAMLVALGAAIELAIRFAKGRWVRAIAIALAIVAFVFVWGMLATG